MLSRSPPSSWTSSELFLFLFQIKKATRTTTTRTETIIQVELEDLAAVADASPEVVPADVVSVVEPLDDVSAEVVVQYLWHANTTTTIHTHA